LGGKTGRDPNTNKREREEKCRKEMAKRKDLTSRELVGLRADQVNDPSQKEKGGITLRISGGSDQNVGGKRETRGRCVDVITARSTKAPPLGQEKEKDPVK